MTPSAYPRRSGIPCGVAPAGPGSPGVGGAVYSWDRDPNGPRTVRCCPYPTWAVETVLAIQGSEALRALNEQKIHALAVESQYLTSVDPKVRESLQQWVAEIDPSRWQTVPAAFQSSDCSTFWTVVDSDPPRLRLRDLALSLPGTSMRPIDWSQNAHFQPTAEALTTSDPRWSAWRDDLLAAFAAPSSFAGRFGASGKSGRAVAPARIRTVDPRELAADWFSAARAKPPPKAPPPSPSIPPLVAAAALVSILGAATWYATR